MKIKTNRINLCLENEMLSALLAKANGNSKKIPEAIREILEEYFAKGSTAKDLFAGVKQLEANFEVQRAILTELMDEISYVKARAKMNRNRNRTEAEAYQDEKAVQQHQYDRRMALLKIWEGK